VYAIPALLVHRRRLLSPTEGPRVLRRAALGMLRSSAFLALYCTLAWRGLCAGVNGAGRTTGAVITLSCWTGGLATLVEKKSRRMELALYCISRVGGWAGDLGRAAAWRGRGCKGRPPTSMRWPPPAAWHAFPGVGWARGTQPPALQP
jgi:hypothetical protein